MSSLSRQLSTLKSNTRALPSTPNLPKPTLLLTQHTATTTSSDIIYTMAVIAYASLVKKVPTLKIEGEEIMGQELRGVKRNQMGKEGNRRMGEKVVRFMVRIAPYFMEDNTQKVIQYLLHNYQINLFEAQALAIIFLQYWQTPLYSTLISNIPPKVLQNKLSFLSQVTSTTQKEPINFTFILKNLSYSHFLMSSVVMYTLEFIKNQQQNYDPGMDIQVALGQEYLGEEGSSGIVRNDPRRFLLQIFNEFIQRKMNHCYKYVLEFCGKAISNTKNASSQTCSMVMLLATRLLIQHGISDELLQLIVRKLLKIVPNESKSLSPLFDFLLILWQRKAACITQKTLVYLESSQHFHQYLNLFKCSLWMVQIDLLKRMTQGELYPKLIELIGHRVKKDQFYMLYKERYLEKTFQLLERIIQSENKQINEFVITYFQAHFQHQTGCLYNNKLIEDQKLKKVLIHILPKAHTKWSKTGLLTCNISAIPTQTVQVQQFKQSHVHIQQEESEEQSVIEEHKVVHEKHPLLSLLNQKGLNVASVNFKDESTKEKLLQCISDYYNGTGSLTSEQKNHIFEQYIELYNLIYFEKDLKKADFILPIKYLTLNVNPQGSKLVLQALVTDIKFNEDLLFRQLFRIAIGQISDYMHNNYKGVIYELNTFFKKMINKYLSTEQRQQIEVLKLSDILIRVSAQMFGKNGIKKGKYQKIIHNHGRIIAELVLGLKSKKQTTKTLNNDQRGVLDHYMRIVRIFGKENLYLLNIGIIEVLTRKELDHGHIRYFISKLLLGSIKESAVDFYDLGLSVAKTIVFCSQLGNCLGLKDTQIDPLITSGIAKKTIVDFYGLIKDKFKKVMIKKMLLFIRGIFQSTYLTQTFKMTLVELEQLQLNRLLQLFTEVYRILTMISSSDNQILQFKDTIIENITNLFPLDLKLILFEPLLPNQHLYAYLANQLEAHSPAKTQYEQLSSIMNIVPEEVTFEWVRFTRECLKRNSKVSSVLVEGVLSMIDLQGTLSTFAQFICDVSEYDPESLYGYLPTCIQVFQKHSLQPNDFTLALVARLINNLGELIEPYLQNLILTSLSIDSQFTPQFIQAITTHLNASTLIKFIRDSYKKTQHFQNFSLLFKATASKGVGQALNKTLLNFVNKTLLVYLQNEESPKDILKLQGEIFVNVGLKMNEHQLRKFIIDLVRWSQMKSQIEDNLPFNYRKIAVAQIYCLMSQNLQTLFNPFYGYIFDTLIKDLQQIGQSYEDKEKAFAQAKSLKRPREANTQPQEELTELYLGLALQSLQMLFKNDNDHEFLDSVKVQALGDPLTDLVLLSQHDRFSSLVSERLHPCLLAFHAAIADDYQMKTINSKLIVFLKRKNHKLHKFILQVYEGLIDTIHDRFLLLVTDLAPFLLEAVSSRQEGIAKTSRRIITKIQELSGQQIANYTR